jgi:recombination protein RecR
MYAEAIQRLIKEFSKLPGIGERSAERITFYLLNQPKQEVLKLAKAIDALKDELKLCHICFNISVQQPCEICSNEDRDHSIICVVEQLKDLWSIEKSGSFKGLYHLLHGCIAPLDGIGPDELTIDKLVERIKKEAIKEVILATNPTAEGDATAFYIQSLLEPLGIKITRIARGVPVGTTLDYMNKFTISDAIKGRAELKR